MCNLGETHPPYCPPWAEGIAGLWNCAAKETGDHTQKKAKLGWLRAIHIKSFIN